MYRATERPASDSDLSSPEKEHWLDLSGPVNLQVPEELRLVPKMQYRYQIIEQSEVTPEQYKSLIYYHSTSGHGKCISVSCGDPAIKEIEENGEASAEASGCAEDGSPTE